MDEGIEALTRKHELPVSLEDFALIANDMIVRDNNERMLVLRSMRAR